MAKDVIGIDISDASIEAIVLDKNKGNFVVEAYSRYRLSPDIVDDGKVLQADKLKEALKGLLTNAQPRAIQQKKVFLSLPESKIFTKVIDLPKNIRTKDLTEIARHKAEESIPESFDRLVVTTKQLPDSKDNKQVLYTAVELEAVNQFLAVFADLGMEVVGLVPESLSSFAGLAPKLEKLTTLLLDLGSRTSIASIFDSNGIRDSININIAGDDIVKAIVEKLDLPYTQAEEKMKQFGMTSDGDGGTMLIIQGQLQPLVDELKRFINYFQEKNGKNVEQLVLIGGLAQMKGINIYFGENLALPTYIGEPFISHEALPDFVDSPTFINVLGLAKMPYYNPEINFLNNFVRKNKDKKIEENLDETIKSEIPAIKAKRKMNFNFSPIFEKIKVVISNKYFIILLLLVLLFILFLIFKDKILPDKNFNNPLVNTNQALVNNTSGLNSQQAVNNIPKSLKYEVVIGINPDGEQENFILAEYFNLVLNKQYQDSNISYNDLISAMRTDADNDVFSGVNIKYRKDDYIILPVIVSSDILSTSPLAEEFKSGDTLNMRLAYTLLAVPKDNVYKILEPKLTESGILITDKQKLYDSIVYTPKGYDPNLQVYNLGLEVLVDRL